MRDPVPVHCAGTPQAESVGACQDLFSCGLWQALMIWNQEVKTLEEKANNFMETEKNREADAKVFCTMYYFTGGGGSLQHRGPDLYRKCRLSGSYGNAANTVVFPLTVVALSIAVMIGDGCCAFVSISLGAGKKEDAHRSIGNAIVLCIICSIILTAVYLIFMEPLLTIIRRKG